VENRKMEASWEYVVVLHFWTFQDCSGKEIAQRFLDTMYRFGSVPDKFGDEDPPRHNFKPSSTGSFLKLWRRRPGQLNMLKLGRMGFQALLSLSGPMPGLITFAIHDEYFQGTENTAKFLEFSDELYEMFKPVSGEISHKKEWDSKTVVIEPIKVGNKTVNAEAHIAVRPTKGLPGIFWVNYFGPTFVDFYTRAKLEAAPCYNKKRFADGGYRVLTGPSPLDYAKPETKKMEQDLIEHLGPDTFFDKTLPNRTLRSPFPLPQNVAASATETSPSRSTMSQSLRSCPECGESKTVKTSRDSVNSLIGFKCSTCGARWMVHSSLL